MDRYRGVEQVQPLYRRFIVRAADFLAAYRDPATGLPLPSWDLWEERRGVMTFTCATVWGGLDAADLKLIGKKLKRLDSGVPGENEKKEKAS